MSLFNTDDGSNADAGSIGKLAAMMLREVQNKELRKAAIEQMKILVGLNDAKI